MSILYKHRVINFIDIVYHRRFYHHLKKHMVYRGLITFLHDKKQYGFIDSLELNLESIFFHITAVVKEYTSVREGDEVLFDMSRSIDNYYSYEAENISFVTNTKLDQLKEYFEKSMILNGWLKKIGDKFYVKEIKTYIFIKLHISTFEINREETYEQRINQLVRFKICLFSPKNKLQAILSDISYGSEYIALTTNQPLLGVITDKLRGGYNLKVLDERVLCFLPGSEVVKSNLSFEQITIGQQVQVLILKVNLLTDNVLVGSPVLLPINRNTH